MNVLDIRNPFNAPVYYKETVTSTMDISKELELANEAHGTVITADFQEAGRGRIKERIWEMDRGNLPFTILLRFYKPQNIPPALTLRAGLAVSCAIEDLSPCLKDAGKDNCGGVFVKWPNDIMIGAKKTAGILCQASGGNVHLGIGINVLQKEFPVRLQGKATSIALSADNIKLDRYCLLEKILARLYEEIETSPSNDWKIRLEQRLYKKGEKVVFIDGAAGAGREVKGLLAGIGDSGELLIVPEGEKIMRPFITGELSFF